VTKLVKEVVASIARGRCDDGEHHGSMLVPIDITNAVVLHLAGRVPGMLGRRDVPTDQAIDVGVMLRCAQQLSSYSHGLTF
jgi:hypothetical protein